MSLIKPPVLPTWADSGDQVQPSNAEIQVGWPLTNTPPARQRWNWLLNYLMNGVRYFARRGMPDYGADETYMTGDRVIGDDGKTYRSIQDTNLNHTPSSSPLWWERWGFSKTELTAELNNHDYKDSCRVATTANLAALSGLLTVDGVATVAGDRVLVKDQTTGSQNGIYVVAAGAWSRATDFDENAEVTASCLVGVESGTAQMDTLWMLTTDNPIVVGVTALSFTNIQGNVGTAGTYNSVTTDAKGRVVSGQSINYTRKNVVINGSFDVWQLGTSIVVAAGGQQYTADQWWFQNAVSGGAAHTIAQVAGLGKSRYAARLQRNSGQTGVAANFIEQPFALDDFAHLRGQASYLSFRAKAGANFSPSSGTVAVYLMTGTNSESRRGSSAYTGEVIQLNASSIQITGAEQLFGFSIPALPANAAQACMQIYWTPTGTAGAADYFDISEVQWEPGTVVTDFERFKRPQIELLCMNFLEVQTYINTAVIGTGQAISASVARLVLPFRTKKRIVPAISVSASGTVSTTAAAGGSSIGGALSAANNSAFTTEITLSGGGGMVAGNCTEFLAAPSQTAVFTIDARL
jgi:hypothetical protein